MHSLFQKKWEKYMQPLSDRIEAGKALALSRIKNSEPEVGWFVDAIEADFDRDTGEVLCFRVKCHYWKQSLYFIPAPFGNPSALEIADRMICWVQEAMKRKDLKADDPPLDKSRPLPPKEMLAQRVLERLAELRGQQSPPASG